MKLILQTIVVVAGIVNIVLFGAWLSIIRATALSASAVQAAYHFDQISFQITLFESFLAVMAIVLAVLAFFGFQFAVERAEMRADKAAREVVARLHKDGRLASPAGTSMPPHSTPPVGNVPVTQTQLEDEV